MNTRFFIYFISLINLQVCAKTANLIDIKIVNSNIKTNLIFATPKNITKQPVYPSGTKCYIDKEVAQALNKVQLDLENKYKYGLLIIDAYRPQSVQITLWKYILTLGLNNPEDFLFNPYTEARNCRGRSVDVTLINLKDYTLLNMPPADLSASSYQDATKGLTKEQINNRNILKESMIKHGFESFDKEWFHFDYMCWQDYDILDISFEDL